MCFVEMEPHRVQVIATKLAHSVSHLKEDPSLLLEALVTDANYAAGEHLYLCELPF